jgi:plastocyanin
MSHTEEKKMRKDAPILTAFGLVTALVACSGGGTSVAPGPQKTATPTAVPTRTPTPAPSPTPTPTAAPSSSPSGNPSPTAKPTKAPQITVHIGFNHAQITDPTYGNVAFYALSASDPNAQVIDTSVGAEVTFLNDDPSQSEHTASGLGSSGFPGSFDNSSGFTSSGTQIDGGLTWSTGTLNHNGRSQVFTIPAAGTYYFGCAFHYDSSGMRDVIVAQ